MRKGIIWLLLALLICSAACGEKTSSVSAQTEDKAYVYPGEERQMAYKNPAYTDEAYAEGKTYTLKFTDEGIKEQFSYTGTIHWVECKNNHVFTVLSLPEGADVSQKVPLVLMLHGFNSTLDEWNYYVKPFNDAGYACLLFDFRGGHSGSQSRSDGKITQMSFDTKLADVRAVLEYAKTIEQVDPDQLILAGHSQGGMMSLISMCDEALSKAFNGVLLLAPYTDATIVSSYEKAEDVPDSASLLICTVGKDYLYSAWKYEHIIWEKLNAYQLPVLILTGDMDEIVKTDSVEKVRQAIGENASMHVIEGGYHDFQPEIVLDVTEKLILPFFENITK